MGNFFQLVIKFLLLVLLFAQTELICQDITIVNNYPIARDAVDEENFVLSKVSQHTYIVNEYVPLESGPRNQLNQMIIYGLRSYIDNHYYSEKGSVVATEGSVEFNKSASAIVRNAIWIHDHPFHEAFKTFSPGFISKVAAIKKLDGMRLKTGSMELSPPENGVMNLYAFQRMVYELKVAAEREAADFLDKYLGKSDVVKSLDNPTTSKSTSPQLDEFIYQLQPVPRVADDLAALKPNVNDQSFNSKPSRPRRGDPYSAQIVELLAKNNKILENYGYRFEDLQNQINEIRNDQSVEGVRDEVKAMSEMIREVLNARPGGASANAPVTSAFQSSIILIFDKNEYDLSIGQQAQLNKAVLELRLDPSLTALVNGYADKTGDAEINARISRLRALAVGDYLNDQGVASNRLIINFLGDQESDSANPADRKVEVILLKN